MPRTLHPDLRECLERANPLTDYIIEVSAPDIGRVLRRAEDEFLATPPTVSEAPAGSTAASPTGGMMLTATAARLAQQEGAVVDATDIRPFPRDKHLKGLGWTPDGTFDRCRLRSFQARIERKLLFPGVYVRSRVQLQIYRATGTPGTLRYENGTTRRLTQWSFAELLNPPAILTDAQIPWAGGNPQAAWANFNLEQYGIVLENTRPRGDADVTEEKNRYYFELIALDVSPNADDFMEWSIAAGATNQATVGVFRRTWWDRPSGDDIDPWIETQHNDTPLFRIDADHYNPAGGFGERVWAVDLGRAPLAASSGRIALEASKPSGTNLTLEISTAGAGGPWTAAKHGDPIAVKQQTYHLRARLYPGVANRSTPVLWAAGVEFRTAYDASLFSNPDFPGRELAVPDLKPSIPEGKLQLLRVGRRDYEDLASVLGSSFSPSTLEVDIYLGSRHPMITREKWFHLERMTVSHRDPSATHEDFTLLSYLKKLKRKIPTPLESINTVHTVDAAPAPTELAISVSPVLLGTTLAGNEYDGKGYYLRVRKSSQPGVATGQIFRITGNTGTKQLDFTGTDALPGLLAAGDEVEVHSGVYAQPSLSWIDADPAEAQLEIILDHEGIPAERVGRGDLGRLGRAGLPPRVTDIAPGDVATQDKLKITGRLDEAEEGWKALGELAFITGGAWIDVAGQLVYRQIYPLYDANGVVTVPPEPVAHIFDPREWFDLSTPTGLEERTTIVQATYGVNHAAADPNTFPAKHATYVDGDALNYHTQQDLEALGKAEIPDEVSRWLYNTADQGLFLASALGQRVVHAGSTGLRQWTWGSVFPHPELLPGDTVVVITNQYTDYEPSFGVPIRGWYAYRLILVGVHDNGRRFRGYMLGLLGNAIHVRGGPGTLQGPYAPIDMPEDFAVVVETQPTPQGGVLQLKLTATPPSTPFLADFDVQLRSRPTGSVDWGAPGGHRMTREGLGHIKVDYNADYEVTARARSVGGNLEGEPEVRIVATGLPPAASPLIGNPIRESTRIRWPYTWDANGKRMEVWYRLDSADPGSAVPQYGVGTKLPVEFHRDDGNGEISIAIPGATWWATISAVFFNAWDDKNAAGIITRKEQGAAPVVPPDIPNLVQTGGYPTTTEQRVDATMPADVTNVASLQVYRDGVAYGSPIARTAGAGGVQTLAFTGLTPGNTHQWKVKARNAAGIESTNFSPTVTATHPGGQIPAPTITVGNYSISQEGFTITVTPAPGTPDGYTSQGQHSFDGGAWLFIEGGTSTIFHREVRGPVPMQDIMRVRLSHPNWTTSDWSNEVEKTVPKEF